jgi:hypothetical protein
MMGERTVRQEALFIGFSLEDLRIMSPRVISRYEAARLNRNLAHCAVGFGASRPDT